MEHPIDKAIRVSDLKTVSALARKLGVTRAAVEQWKDEGRRVPPKHCPEIEKLSNGEVRCEELNSEVDWQYVRSTGHLPTEAEVNQ